jgi:hypothetical protein
MACGLSEPRVRVCSRALGEEQSRITRPWDIRRGCGFTEIPAGRVEKNPQRETVMDMHVGIHQNFDRFLLV